MTNLQILLLTAVPYYLDELGFNVAYFILGMAGGFVRSIIRDKATVKHGLINITVGGIVSTYFTALVCHKLGFKEKEQIFATALSLGFFAMGAFDVYEKMETWAKRNPKFFIAIVINWLTRTAKSLTPPDTSTPQSPEDGNLPKSDTGT